jgi:glycine/D-amino acid oxidase-like deaminating enzyme
LPTETGKAELIEKIEADLNIPYTIMDHQAAIRPTIKDRRPVLGTHPEYANLILFNGLGTKGASLGPYWTSEMVRFLINGDAIDAPVNLSRFIRFYSK